MILLPILENPGGEIGSSLIGCTRSDRLEPQLHLKVQDTRVSQSQNGVPDGRLQLWLKRTKDVPVKH